MNRATENALPAAWAIGIDIGGTFTDVVALNYGDGQLRSLKVLTTHGDPTEGVVNGVEKLMLAAAIHPSHVTRVVHATTLFTNALIERRGVMTGLIATDGFTDVIEIGNERKYDLYDLQIEAAEALIERRLRAGISARVRADGTELIGVDSAEVVAAVKALVNEGVESLAVCLLHAYAYPVHERQVRDIVLRNFPGLDVTLSSDIAPVVREFDRLSTTAANAYIKPLANRYLTALQRRLQALGLPADVLMMLSNGGLSHIEEAKKSPIELLESGPAAGAISAAHYSLRDAQPDLLAFDMGGTTAKLCLIEHGQPSIAFGFEAARQKRFAEGSGLPIRITTIDLIEIGSGGGSIAHQDVLGLLKVGPQSAGSEPGPACYGMGGTQPTVTDANLKLGYLNPAYFAGGTLAIDPQLASDALGTLGRALGRDEVGTAWGIHDIVAENMAGAARVHVAERGRDPRDFVLLCTGGGGPLHAYYVAKKIGIKTIICPPDAGVASAYGLLVSPARADRSQTVSVRLATQPMRELEAAFAELTQKATGAMEALNETFGPVVVRRSADGRFAGQGFSLTVRLPDGPYAKLEHADDTRSAHVLPEESGLAACGENESTMRAALIEAFESGYREKFGRMPPNVAIELVNLRVTAEAPPRAELKLTPLVGAEGIQAKPKTRRRVYFHELRDFIDTPIYARRELTAGFDVQGPMLIEDSGSTLVVGPLGHVRQLDTGNLVITIQEQA